MFKIAILLTCHNRIEKTGICLKTLTNGLKAKKIDTWHIYLVDDNSTDGTSDMVKQYYPEIILIRGTGFLFWAGGMRLAWNTALKSNNEYDGFLLINDDVEFIDSFWDNILYTRQWCKENFHKEGIYVLSVRDKDTNKYSYGGYQFRKRIFKHSPILINPTDQPQLCDTANANILYISSEVVEKIGIFDSRFTHALADFDYTLNANKNNIPVIICPEYGGCCTDDHKGERRLLNTLKKRIKYLYSIKGFALNEYLYYLKKHFWWKAPYAFLALWVETLFPYKDFKSK